MLLKALPGILIRRCHLPAFLFDMQVILGRSVKYMSPIFSDRTIYLFIWHSYNVSSKVKSKITVIIDKCKGLIFHIIGSYLHADGLSGGAVAHLVSPPLYNVSCLSFYYYMFGSQIGRLNVYKLIQGNYTQLLQLTGNQGNRWYKSQLALGQDALYSNVSVSIISCIIK
jgi:hypothetical protein